MAENQENKNTEIIKDIDNQYKNFNYEINGVKLNFSLRVDVPEQLADFKKLMLEAVKDIDVELEKLANK